MTHQALMVEEVFNALADETRRHILEHLGEDGAQSASALAVAMPVSRQAIAKHLKLLQDAGLVTRARAGREINYAVSPENLSAIGRWLQRSAERWERHRH